MQYEQEDRDWIGHLRDCPDHGVHRPGAGEAFPSSQCRGHPEDMETAPVGIYLEIEQLGCVYDYHMRLQSTVLFALLIHQC